MKRLLVVDDSSMVRQYCRQIGESLGYQVQEAVNGLEGLEQALQQSFDLYLVDINMAKLDGYGFVRELRSRALPQVPVLMMSTEAAADDAFRAYAAGANLFLTKPVQSARLKACIRLLLGEVPA